MHMIECELVEYCEYTENEVSNVDILYRLE